MDTVEQDKHIEAATVYQTVSKRFEGLREQQYKLPSIFAALVGALWYFAVQQIGKDRFLAAAVFLFATAVSAACLHAMSRFRIVFNNHLTMLNRFEGDSAIKMPEKTVSTNEVMRWMLLLALIYSICGIPYALLR